MLPNSNLLVAVFGTYVLIACVLMAFGVWHKVWLPETDLWRIMPISHKFIWYFLCCIIIIASTLLVSFFVG